MRYSQNMDREELKGRIADRIEREARSGSMHPALITPEYLCRLLGGTVPLEVVREVMEKCNVTNLLIIKGSGMIDPLPLICL